MTLADWVKGSSPQVRGARERSGRDRRGGGIIPAGAGSTSGTQGARRTAWDHPRRCGEHSTSSRSSRSSRGSSPQVRGALVTLPRRPVNPGIIPAGAGSTDMKRLPSSAVRDHPRRCGEHWAWFMSRTRDKGSSPQVRGAPYPVRRHEVARGIIPAGAGSTPTDCCGSANLWDHPRRCGEHSIFRPVWA